MDKKEKNSNYYVYKTENGLAHVAEVEKIELFDYLIGTASTIEEAQKILLAYILKPVRKYRLGYDYVFLPKNKFEYKGDLIGSMSIMVLFKIYDMESNEILFESKEDELKEQKLKLRNGEEYYLCDLFYCFFDKELFKESKTFEFNPTMNAIMRNCRVDMTIVSYTKDVDNGILEPVKIDKKEFSNIILSNLDLFDITDNKPAQSVSYITEEVQLLN